MREGERERRGGRGVPSCFVGGAEAAPVAIRAFGVDGGGARCRRRSRRPSGRHRHWPGTGDDDVAAVKAPAASYPAAGCALTRSARVCRWCRWGVWRHGQPRELCRHGPHLFYCAQCGRGATSHRWAGSAPIRAREGKARLGSVGHRDGVEIKLTISPLISLCIFLFLFIYFFSFHHRFVHRACLVVTVNRR